MQLLKEARDFRFVRKSLGLAFRQTRFTLVRAWWHDCSEVARGPSQVDQHLGQTRDVQTSFIVALSYLLLREQTREFRREFHELLNEREICHERGKRRTQVVAQRKQRVLRN